jgi:hypothetical protein
MKYFVELRMWCSFYIAVCGVSDILIVKKGFEIMFFIIDYIIVLVFGFLYWFLSYQIEIFWQYLVFFIGLIILSN